MTGRSFELQRELGDGAFGTVYLADMVSMGGFRKSVAIKLLKPDWDAASDAARRLRDEARLLGRLRHRHIVQVDDLIRLDGRWAVVMEYVPGVDLEVVIDAARQAGTRISPPAALEITAAVAQALDAAWNGSAGDDEEPLRVVHRDIKPSNIRITAQGDLKVLDFGIARAEFQGREAKTDKIRYGSVGYMAPERLLGDPEVPGGDIYAVGVVLYELLTLDAFGRCKLAPQKAEQQLTEKLAFARESLPDLPEAVFTFIADCMHYEVEKRPTAHDVAVRARQLARQLDGPDIFAFARGFVPDLDVKLPGRQISNRQLTEEQIDSQTFAFDEDGGPVVPAPGASKAVPPASPSQAAMPTQPTLEHAVDDRPGSNRRTGVVAAVVVVLMLGSALTGLWVMRSGDPGSSGTTTTTAVRTPQVVEPSVAEVGSEAGSEVGSAAPEAAPPEDAAPEAAAPDAAAAQPAAPEPTTPEPAAAQPADPEPPPETAAATPAPAPASSSGTASTARIDRAKFYVEGASTIAVSCGSVSNSSTTASVNLKDFPAGACSIRASVDGADLRTSVNVQRSSGYQCSASDGGLSCKTQL